MEITEGDIFYDDYHKSYVASDLFFIKTILANKEFCDFLITPNYSEKYPVSNGIFYPNLTYLWSSLCNNVWQYNKKETDKEQFYARLKGDIILFSASWRHAGEITDVIEKAIRNINEIPDYMNYYLSHTYPTTIEPEIEEHLLSCGWSIYSQCKI